MKPKPIKLQSLISIRDFNAEKIMAILNHAASIKKGQLPPRALAGKLMATCFFEPSTRTRLSFEAAMKQLGGDVIGFAEGKSSSASKKESLFDTIKVVSHYADLIVLRHPLDGAARLAMEATSKPVINAGDGTNQHPTQTLLDLFTIWEANHSLEGLHIAFVGDLKHGRAAHSLIQAAALFNMRMYFVSQPGLTLDKQSTDELKRNGVLFSFHNSLQEIIHKLDVVYMTRRQEERMSGFFDAAIQKNFILTTDMLQNVKPQLKIMHPLPRVNEIDRGVDKTPYAHYFVQAENGVPLRQALLDLILSGDR
jgi:aspartate carbamoyltransferase catalytic subunit